MNVTAYDEEALKIALVNEGPISIAIYASLKTFSFYSNGVYYDKECRKYLFLTHSIAYDTKYCQLIRFTCTE